MEKADVIKMRTALKGGKNLPLLIHINNLYAVIDERNTFEFTVWDDDNELLYLFRLVGMVQETIPSNKSEAISVFCTHYDTIEAMELPQLPLETLDDVVGTIEATGKTFKDGFKELIKNTYETILKGNYADLTHGDINKLIGSKLNDKDDYYNGKFTEPSKYLKIIM